MTSQGHQYLLWGRYSLLAIQMIFLESHESFEWCKDLSCVSLPSFFIEKGSVTSVKKKSTFLALKNLSFVLFILFHYIHDKFHMESFL